MADPTADAPPETSGETPVAASTGTSETAAALAQSKINVRDLLEAGVHFGHQTRRWNPRMKRFLFGERSGVHIIDLDQSLPRFRDAIDFLRETTAAGGKVLFVGTKRQAQEPIRLEAERSGQFFVNNRWLGGMLTNFKTVKKSIERFKQLLEVAADEEKVAELSKKELARVHRQIGKYKKCLDGMKEMVKLPDAVFVIDVGREAIAVSEARRLGIPIVAIVDSNCDPLDIDFVVPGNDDAIRAIQLYCSRVANACLEGAAIHNDRIQSQVPEEGKGRAGGATPTPGTGRVVVEIKQQPRRARSHGDRREEGAASAPSAPARAATPAPAAPATADAAPAAEEAAPATADATPAAEETAPEKT